MRNCERSTDGQYCGRLHATTRTITVATAATAPADLAYEVDLCAAHAAEFDREAL